MNVVKRDTRILLCSTDGGNVHAMTEDHHAETRGEAARLRRLGGTGLITDSFGEARYAANPSHLVGLICTLGGWEHWQIHGG